MLHDLGLIDEVPPWYSPAKPKPVYESVDVQAYWDVPVFVDHEEVRCNRVNARIGNHKTKRIATLEMSCPWVSKRGKKNEEKTVKYAPLRWELKQQFLGYEVKQHNIIIDALGGWSREMDTTMGSRDGAVVEHLSPMQASHQCGPGSIPGLGVKCGLSLLLVLVLAPRGFSPGTPVFPSPQKPTFPNSN